MSNRGMTAAYLAAAQSQQMSVVHLVEFYFAATVYLTDAPGPVTWSGNTYNDSAGLVTIDGAGETFDLTIGTVSFTFAGAVLANLSLALTENFTDERVILRRALVALTDMTLNPRNSCSVSGTTISKLSGVSGWDSDCYSTESYTNGAHCSFSVANTSYAFMIGLNADPLTDQSYTSLDYAWYCNSDLGQWEIHENGALILSGGSYSVGDVFSITYDGTNVTYYQNGVLKHTTAAAANLILFLDSSFRDVGAVSENVTFKPLGLNIIADPLVIWDGRIDSWDFTEEPDTGNSLISWHTSNNWVDFDRVTGRMTNSASQQLFYAGDTGLNYADKVVLSQVRWPGPATAAQTGTILSGLMSLK